MRKSVTLAVVAIATLAAVSAAEAHGSVIGGLLSGIVGGHHQGNNGVLSGIFGGHRHHGGDYQSGDQQCWYDRDRRVRVCEQ